MGKPSFRLDLRAAVELLERLLGNEENRIASEDREAAQRFLDTRETGKGQKARPRPDGNWRPVPDWEGIYEISDDGRIWAMPRKNARGWTFPGRVREPHLNGHGYLRIKLSDHPRRQKAYLMHRLLWEAFRGPIPEGMQIDHINGVRSDNSLENLRVLSQTDNLRAASHICPGRWWWILQHVRQGMTVASAARWHGVKPSAVRMKATGEGLYVPEGMSHNRGLTDAQVFEALGRLRSGETVSHIGRILGVKHGVISQIRDGKTYVDVAERWRQRHAS